MSVEIVAENLQARPVETYRGMIWRRFRKNSPAMVSIVFVALVAIIALLAPVLANNTPLVLKLNDKFYFPILKQYDDLKNVEDFRVFKEKLGPGDWMLMPPVPFNPNENNLDEVLDPPGGKHWLGTDDSGRDLMSRMIHGARIPLTVGFVAVSIYIFIGVIMGSLAGYYGGNTDIVISRIIEVVICFPTLFLIISVVAILSPNIFIIMAAIGFVGWPNVARLVRGEFLRLKNMDFVMAAKAAGARDQRIIFVHILPNALSPVLVSATFGIAGAIISESALSFLGFGVPPPTPSWGAILSQSQGFIAEGIGIWLAIFPGLAIFFTVTALNLVGEGLRDAVDPWLKK